MKTAVFCSAPVLVLILLFEAALRIGGWAKPLVYFHEVFAAPLLGDLAPSDSRIKADRAGNRYRFTTSSLGLRTTGRPVGNPGRVLLCLGDSYTLGFVDDSLTFPFLLQNLLRPRGIQVYNAGYSGYTMEDEVSYLLDKGMRLNPDMVVVAFCPNDFHDYDESFRRSFKRHGKGAWRRQHFRNWLKRNIHILSLAKRIKVTRIQEKHRWNEVRNVAFDAAREVEYLQDIPKSKLQAFRRKYAEDFGHLHQVCRKNGILLVAVVFPMAEQVKGIEPLDNQHFLDSLYASRNIASVDLMDHVGSHPADSLFIADDGHPTALANRIVAREVVSLLSETESK